MAAASSQLHLTTVEGSSNLAPVAAANLRVTNPNATVVNAMFDDALDSLLPQLTAPLDIVHIDGQHESVSTFHYLERVRPHLRKDSLVIFDDIHWSADMRQAWNDLKATDGFSHCIDVGRYGVCVWGGADVRPQAHNLSRYTADWRNENHQPGPSYTAA
jgi:predicted O-methyltransferase YrrM